MAVLHAAEEEVEKKRLFEQKVKNSTFLCFIEIGRGFF